MDSDLNFMLYFCFFKVKIIYFEVSLFFDVVIFFFLLVIDGNYIEWFEWFECNVICGGGVYSCLRMCINFLLKNGGNNCEGLGLVNDI